jgi:hypothetical protein
MSMPTPEELARTRHQLSTGLLAMSEQMAPMFDAADGMRADMEKRGWSPTAAEHVALTWLVAAMNTAMGAQR